MEKERAETARSSLRVRLALATNEQKLDSEAQVSWLMLQLENYLERWLAFCEMPDIPMKSLLHDDLCSMVYIGVDEMSTAIDRLSEDHGVRAAWTDFCKALTAVQVSSARSEALRLRDVFARVKMEIM